MITTTGRSTAEKWLLALFITEKKWPRYLFFGAIYVLNILYIILFPHNSLPYKGNILLLFMAVVNAGRYLCSTYLFRGQTLQFTAHFLFGFILMTVIFPTSMYIFTNEILYKSLWLSYLIVAPFILFSLCVGIGLKMVRHTMRQHYLAATQQKHDLDMLLSQLSPHFLFNTLNNLYGLSLTQSQRMPGLILQLSDLLRYTVYDARQDFVPLQSEIAYINNYIELATTNIGDRLKLTTDIAPVTDPDIKIAPMLLIVFIENAFKHSQNDAAGKIYIDIRLTVSEKRICFTVKNSYNTQETDTIAEVNGVGLTNTVKRLELLYSDTYQYRHEKSDGFYIVTLTIPVKK